MARNFFFRLSLLCLRSSASYGRACQTPPHSRNRTAASTQKRHGLRRNKGIGTRGRSTAEGLRGCGARYRSRWSALSSSISLDSLDQIVEDRRLATRLTRKSIAARPVRDYDPNRRLRVLLRYRRHRMQHVSLWVKHLFVSMWMGMQTWSYTPTVKK